MPARLKKINPAKVALAELSSASKKAWLASCGQWTLTAITCFMRLLCSNPPLSLTTEQNQKLVLLEDSLREIAARYDGTEELTYKAACGEVETALTAYKQSQEISAYHYAAVVAIETKLDTVPALEYVAGSGSAAETPMLAAVKLHVGGVEVNSAPRWHMPHGRRMCLGSGGILTLALGCGGVAMTGIMTNGFGAANCGYTTAKPYAVPELQGACSGGYKGLTINPTCKSTWFGPSAASRSASGYPADVNFVVPVDASSGYQFSIGNGYGNDDDCQTVCLSTAANSSVITDTTDWHSLVDGKPTRCNTTVLNGDSQVVVGTLFVPTGYKPGVDLNQDNMADVEVTALAGYSH